MKDQTQNKRNTFLVLLDFSKASFVALRYAVMLAKETECAIDLLHVINTSEVIKSDNQLIAMRETRSEHKKIEEKLKSLEEIIASEGVVVNSNYVNGNVIEEIKKKIKQINPILVVIGKKQKSNWRKGKTTSYLLHKNSHNLLILGEEKDFKKDSEVTICCNQNTLSACDNELIFTLDQSTNLPFTLCNIRNPGEPNKSSELSESWNASREKRSFTRVESTEHLDVVSGIVSHVNNHNVDMLCISRGTKKRNKIQRLFSKPPIWLEVMSKVDVPVLLLKKKFVPND